MHWHNTPNLSAIHLAENAQYQHFARAAQNMIRAIQLTLLSVICNSLLDSQIIHPHNRAQVDMHVSVTHNLAGDFYFVYAISNRQNSQEACDDFTLLVVDSLITHNITKITAPTNKKWFVDGSELGFISGTAAGQFVNFPIAPQDAIFPGESISISFSSPGLPSIMTYYAESYALPLTTDENDSLHALGYTDKQIMPRWEDDSYKNLTVAPNTDLLKLLPLILLDTLINYTTQSRTLGWITNQATTDKYSNYFTTAKTLITFGHNDSGRDTLQTVITNAINDSTNNITSEAYALLRFNAEYLLHNIPALH